MKEKLKIGVTGASGLVGSYLCVELNKQFDCEIRALHISGHVPSKLKEVKIDWIKGSILDIGILEEFCNGLDFIIHTAAKVSFKKSESDEMFRVNVEGTKELVNQIIASKSKVKLLHISSIATLGRTETGEIDESIFWNEEVPHTDYAKSKFLSEMEVFRGLSEGLEAMIFQPSIILGNTERETGSSSIWNQISSFPWIAPQGQNGFVDVQDVTKYLIASISNWKNGEKIILNGFNFSYKKLYEKVLIHSNKSINVRALSPKIILIFLPIIKIIFRVLGKRTEVSKTAIINTSRSYTYNNDKSIELLGDLYTPIDQTIIRYI